MIAVAAWTLVACAGDSNPVDAEPGEPAALQAVTGVAPQTATVDGPVPGPPAVQVTDDRGGPVPGVAVEFTVDMGQGAATPESGVTDTDGRMSTVWTLGSKAGPNTLTARAEGLDPVTFTATGVPDDPAELLRESGNGQRVPPASELLEPLVVRVVDRFGNGISGAVVTWEVEDGDGSPDQDRTTTDAEGRAGVRYTVGTTEGEDRIRARHDPLDPVTFEAGIGGPTNLYIEGLYITQAVQRFEDPLPLVAGRDGLLRVFVVAEDANRYRPDVVVRLFDGPNLVREETIEAAGDSIRTSADEGDLSSSWNLHLEGDQVRPGLRIAVEVDPEDAYPEVDETDNRFPATGSLQMAVRELPEFRVRLVPIHVPVQDTTGAVDEAGKHEYLVDAQKMFPFPGYDVEVRAPFTTASDLESRPESSVLMSELLQLRVAEGSDRYYYGVVPWFDGIGIGAVAYRRSSPDDDRKVAIGPDDPRTRASVAAHEWGHNFGRLHAPCGPVSHVDPDYPYQRAAIGIWGLDVWTGDIKTPEWKPLPHADLMSYCGPEWISDYTYTAVAAFRESEAAVSVSAAAVKRQRTLVVGGRIGDGRVELSPAFESLTTPVLPHRPGPNRLTGIAHDGSVLFSIPFAGTTLADASGSERHFAFALPMDMVQPQRLARLRLTAPGRVSAERRRTVTPGPADVAVTDEGRSRVRLEWDASAYPLVVVRDLATGDILALARGGSAVVLADVPDLNVRLSTGIGEVAAQVRRR